jgi:hypothetical protein
MSAPPNKQRNPIEHDILVVRRKSAKRQYFKVEAEQIKAGLPRKDHRASYRGVAEQSTTKEGFRAVVGQACPEMLQEAGPGNLPRGPALATLPLHPDPTASAACTCYLVNPENLTYETSWTHEEWNDQKVQETDNAVREDDGFRLLVATPAGKVYLLIKRDGFDIHIVDVDLRLEAELWNFLRNGGIAGSVRLVAHPLDRDWIVPIVNVESLRAEPNP